MEKTDAMRMIGEALLLPDKTSAKRQIRKNYPFAVTAGGKRQYTDLQKMRIYLRDRFIDRYSGEKLVNPGLLRTVSYYCPEEFPYHPHGKYTLCHIAFWELIPSVDHVIPVALGGSDDESNLVTASMRNNSIKLNWTLEQLQWRLRPIPEGEQWDGLTKLFLRLVHNDSALLTNTYISRWYRASCKALGV